MEHQTDLRRQKFRRDSWHQFQKLPFGSRTCLNKHIVSTAKQRASNLNIVRTRNRADPANKSNVDEWVGVVVDFVGVIDDNQRVIFVRTIYVPIESAELQQTAGHWISPRTEHGAATLGDFTEQLDLHDSAERHTRSCTLLDSNDTNWRRTTHRQQCLATLGRNNRQCKAWSCSNKPPTQLASPSLKQGTRAKEEDRAWFWVQLARPNRPTSHRGTCGVVPKLEEEEI